MTNNSSVLNCKSVVGFYFFSYFKACYFAGLYRRAMNSPLSGL